MTTSRSPLLNLPGHGEPVAPARLILDWLRYNARHHPNAPAILGIDRSPLSHHDLYHQVRTTGERLLTQGIGRGDVVMISLADRPRALTAILSVASTAVAFPVGIDEPEAAIDTMIQRIRPKAVLIDEQRQSALANAGRRHGLTLLPITGEGQAPAGAFTLVADVSVADSTTEATRIDDAAILFKTSGSTATPKVVALSQASLYLSADTAAHWMKLTEADRSLCVMPLSHLHALVRSLLPGLLRGGSVVCAPRFDPSRVLDWLRAYHPTYMTASPGIYRKLLSKVMEIDWHEPTSLRLLATGSDRMDTATAQALIEHFAAEVREFYGQTETTPMFAATPPGMRAQENGSVGRPMKPWSVVTMDKWGQPLPPEREGEIAVRGGLINPVVDGNDTSERRLANGWFMTGDRGWIDSEGFLHVSGRMDDLINRAGSKISPITIEEAILAHPGVSQAVAFPIPDEELGERVGALAVPSPCGAPSERELRLFIARRLAEYMVPERILITDRLPSTAAGKFSRKEIARDLDLSDPIPRSESARTQPNSAMEREVGRLAGELLMMTSFDLEKDFTDLGGDSTFALAFQTAIEERFDILLTPDQYLGNRNVAAMATLLEKLTDKSEPHHMVRVREGNGDSPLIIVHGIYGNTPSAHTFARHLEDEQSIYALHYHPNIAERIPSWSLENLATLYVGEIIHTQPSGPYFLMGHSFGAMLAFEIAQQLTAAGREVALLALLDDDADLYKRRFASAMTADTPHGTPERLGRLIGAYVPRPYGGRITLFQSEILPIETLADPWMGWNDLAPNAVTRHVIPGSHSGIASEKMVEKWFGVFADEFTRARRGDAPPAGGDGRSGATKRVDSPNITLATQARQAAKTGELDAEIDYYQQAITCDPRQPFWAYRNLGEALLQRGDIDGALKAHIRAMEREEVALPGHLHLIKLLLKLGRRTEAEHYVESARNLPLKGAHSYLALGYIHQAIGSLESAADNYRQAIATAAANDFRGYFRLSELRAEQGRLNEAVDLCRQAIDIASNTPRLSAHLDTLLQRRDAASKP